MADVGLCEKENVWVNEKRGGGEILLLCWDEANTLTSNHSVGILFYYSSHSNLHSSPVSGDLLKWNTPRWPFCFGLLWVYLNSLHQAMSMSATKEGGVGRKSGDLMNYSWATSTLHEGDMIEWARNACWGKTDGLVDLVVSRLNCIFFILK